MPTVLRLDFQNKLEFGWFKSTFVQLALALWPVTHASDIGGIKLGQILSSELNRTFDSKQKIEKVEFKIGDVEMTARLSILSSQSSDIVSFRGNKVQVTSSTT